MSETTRRVALVTGAAGGIGRAVARCLARDGFRLVLTDRNPAVEALAGAIDPAAMAMAGDLTDREFPDRLVEFAVAGAGGVDVLVNGAGASAVRSILEQGDDEWGVLMDANLGAAFRLSRACARTMLRQGRGGAIVSISSIAYQSGGANPAYGAAKAGLVALTYKLAQELGPQGIRANAVAPGVIDTDMVRNALPAEAYDRLVQVVAQRTPLRRLGRAEEVAEVVAFLASDKASFVTGAVVPITGGIELLPPIGNLAAGPRP